MTREEVIEKAAEILYGQPAPTSKGTWAEAARRDARALADGSLLATPALIRCGEACVRYDEAPRGPEADTAWQECCRAGRALKAEREGDGGGPYEVVRGNGALSPWRVRYRSPNRMPVLTTNGELCYQSESDAIRARDALNAAFRSCEHDWSWAGADAHCRKCGQPAKP